MNKLTLAIAFFVLVAVAAMPGCRRGRQQDAVEPSGTTEDSAPWWQTAHTADYSGTVPVDWPLCRPFVGDDYETVRGFLVVEKVKDHYNLRSTGLRVGDICLSWATDSPKVPKTLRDAWLEFLSWGRSDEDVCWFARDNGGSVEVFPCDAGLLYECMVSLGTFGLALTPTPFDQERYEKIEVAAASYRPAAETVIETGDNSPN